MNGFKNLWHSVSPARTGFLGIVVLLLSAIPASGQSQVSSDTLRLEFGWPAGLSGTIDMQSHGSREILGSVDSATVNQSYQFELSEGPSGFLLDFDGLSVPDILGFDAIDLAEIGVGAELFGRLEALNFGYHVTSEGEYVGIDHEDELTAVFGEMLAMAEASLGEAAAQAMPILEVAFSPVGLNEIGEQEWKGLVGYWTGRELRRGRTAQYRTTEPNSILIDMELPSAMWTRFEGWVSCEEGGRELDCVHLHLDSAPQPGVLNENQEVIVEQLFGGAFGDDVTYSGLALKAGIDLVIEPETMIPHRYSIETELRVTVQAEDEAAEFVQTQQESLRFSYPAPTGG